MSSLHIINTDIHYKTDETSSYTRKCRLQHAWWYFTKIKLVNAWIPWTKEQIQNTYLAWVLWLLCDIHPRITLVEYIYLPFWANSVLIVLSWMLSSLCFRSRLGLLPIPMKDNSVRRLSRFLRAWFHKIFSNVLTHLFLLWEQGACRVQFSLDLFRNQIWNLVPLPPTFSVNPKSTV